MAETRMLVTYHEDQGGYPFVRPVGLPPRERLGYDAVRVGFTPEPFESWPNELPTLYWATIEGDPEQDGTVVRMDLALAPPPKGPR